MFVLADVEHKAFHDLVESYLGNVPAAAPVATPASQFTGGYSEHRVDGETVSISVGFPADTLRAASPAFTVLSVGSVIRSTHIHTTSCTHYTPPPVIRTCTPPVMRTCTPPPSRACTPLAQLGGAAPDVLLECKPNGAVPCKDVYMPLCPVGWISGGSTCLAGTAGPSTALAAC